MSLLRQLAASVRDRDLAGPDEKILVAVSGGADSTALLHALMALRERLQLGVAAAHLHHGLRGKEADRDAAFVADLSPDAPGFAATSRVSGSAASPAACTRSSP